jgi:hypothetical protein
MAFERNLAAWLRNGTKTLAAQRRLHMCRVENSAGAGYPDIEGCFDGHCFHLELKGALRPARPETPVRVKFQPAQKPWLMRRWEAGGSCFVLLRVGSGKSTARFLIPGNRLDLVGETPEAELRELSIVSATGVTADVIISVAATFRWLEL